MRLFSINTCSDRASNIDEATARRARRPRTALLTAAAAILLGTAAPPARAANFTCSWNDATADWTTIADWSTCNSTFPNNGSGNAYDVTISTGNPTLTTAITIGSDPTNNSATITSPGAWSLSGATGSANLIGNLTNSGTLDVNAGFGDGGSGLTVGGVLNNSKTVQLGSVVVLGTGARFYGLTAPATMTLGGLVNPAGASFVMEGSPSATAKLAFSAGGSGFAKNDGDFELTYAAPLSLAGSFTNTGTFGVHQNTALTIGGDFANSGALGVDNAIAFTGGVTYSEGGSGLTVGGVLNNSKTVQLGSVVVLGTGARFYGLTAPATMTLGGLVNPAGASFVMEGSPSATAKLAFSAGGSGFAKNDGDFELTYAAPLSLAGSFTNTGTFGVHQNTALTIGGDFANSGALGVDNAIAFTGGVTYSEGGSGLTVGGVLNNSKTVQLGSVVVLGTGARFYGLTAPATMTLGGLVNPAGASFVMEGSPSATAKLAFSAGGSGFAKNDGDFELTYAAPLSLAGSFTNTGTFGVHQNTALTIGGDFANSGALGVDNAIAFTGGVTYSEGGSGLTVGGVLNNSKTVQLGSVVVLGTGARFYGLTAPATMTLGGLVNPAGASFVMEGSPSATAKLAFSAGGSGFAKNDGDFELTYAAPLSLAGSFTNTGTFGVHQNTALTIGGDFANSGALGVDNAIAFTGGVTYSEGGSGLTVGGVLNNSKTVQLGSVVVLGTGARFYGLTAPATMTLGGLVNPAGASFVMEGSPSATAKLAFSAGGSGFAKNDGDFELTYAAPLSLAGSFTNTGTFGVHQNTALTIGGDFANSGALGVDNAIAFTGGVTYSEGGSGLTVGGVLNNSKTVQLGSVVVLGTGARFYGLTAPATMTLGGLVNPAGASFVMEGSPSATAKLAFSAGGSGFAKNDGDFELTYAAPLSLAGSFTNTGTFGVHQNTALTIGGDFANSGALGVDNAIAFTGGVTYSEGGSGLTVGGVLNNSKTVQLGSVVVLGTGARFYGLTAPATMTLGGLVNTSTGTVDLIGNATLPANQASVMVNGQASNAGTINIPTASSVTVTGAGNAYTQTAGFTNLSGGALAAPNVNITGGILQGMGTVRGAVSVSGAGTIEAVNLADSTLPAVLTIDGSYAQSGGTFNALLHGTGVQIDKVDVTAGHTVTLTGGDLEPFGVPFALGQNFDDIMTFEPGELTGTFKTILGKGNGMFADLGGGLALEAFYNNAEGNISLKVVPTPPSGKVWNDATGNWTTDPNKWTAPGAPQPTDDVVIGSTTTGDVTLNNDSTIDSLHMNASNLLTIAGGSTLTVAEAPASGAESVVLDGGSGVTLGGTLITGGTVRVNSGGSLGLSGGTITGSTLAGSGTIQTNPGSTGTLNGVTISAGATFTGQTGSTTTLTGTMVNNGTIDAAGGLIDATTGFNGTGTARIGAGGTMIIRADSTVGTLTHNGTTAGSLNLTSGNIGVSGDYTNANFGTGNGFDKRANVTGPGQILAAGPSPDKMQVITGAKVSGGDTATPTLDLGIVHVGDSTTYRIANQGTAANPLLRGAIQTSVGGGNITGGLLSGSGVTAGNFGPIAPGGSSADLDVVAAKTGVLSGQKVHVANNFGNVREQTMSIVGTIDNFAVSAYGKASGDGAFGGGGSAFTLDFGTLAEGSSSAHADLFAYNAAAAPADDLAGSFRVTDGLGKFLLSGFDPFAGLAPGDVFGGLLVDFDPIRPGVFDETIGLLGIGSNASGYSAPVPDVFLTIHANVTSAPPSAPEPGSMAILSSGLGMIFFVVRRRWRG